MADRFPYRAFSDLSQLVTLPSLVSPDFAKSMANLSDCVTFPFSPVDTQTVLSRIERSPQLLSRLDLTKKPTLPLGRVFERAIHVALQAAFPDRVISANVQTVRPDPQGELDFVMSSLTTTWHLEVALKFFLYIPAESLSLACFHGPQLKDRLDLKAQKIFGQQLCRRIPDHVHAVKMTSVQRSVWLPGMLFYPWQMFHAQDFPDFKSLNLNPRHAKGWWLHCAESRVLNQNRVMLLELSKHDWLRPVLKLTSDEIKVRRRPPEYFAHCFEPTFVARVLDNEVDLDRGFVVPSDWGLVP